MRCPYHPYRNVTGKCMACMKPICPDCIPPGLKPAVCFNCAAAGKAQPSAWENTDPRKVANLCLVLAILGSALSLVLGHIAFLLVTDPEITNDALGAPSFTLEYVGYVIGYFVAASGVGVGIFLVVRKSLIRNKELITLMSIGPGLVMLLSQGLLILIPVARSVLGVLPIVGIALVVYELATSPFMVTDPIMGQRLRKTLYVLGGLAAFEGAGFEIFLLGMRTIGSVAAYVGFVAIGFLVAFIGTTVFYAIRGRERPPPVPGPAALGKAVPVSLAIALIFAIVFMPPLTRLTSPADPEVSASQVRWVDEELRLTIVIINRGGQAIDAPLEVQVNNGTADIYSTKVDSLDGFARLTIVKTVPYNKSLEKNPKLTVILKYKGKEVDQGRLAWPTYCMIPIVVLTFSAVYALPRLLVPSERRRYHR